MGAGRVMMQRAGFERGVREAFGVPAAVAGAGYLGFGALVSGYGGPLWAVVASTLTMWALPGQLVLMDMWQAGAPLVAVLLAVTMTNARFLPMALTLSPLLRDPAHARGSYYATAHFIAMTSWTVCMRRCPELPPPERLPYLAGFSIVCIAVAMVAGALGYVIAGAIPPAVQFGLLFLAPVYFFVMLVGEVRSRVAAIALACGGPAGPLLYLVTPQWSVLAAGFAGGTLAFVIHKSLEHRRA
jgi:predicted branched-subunit amino acid permease